MGDQSEPTTLAYLAGILDSDGYVTVQRTKHAGRIYMAARVGIAGTRRQPHDLAASIFGGNVYSHIPKNPRHRVQFQWCRDGKAAVAVIEAVRPFLRIKGAQADLAVRLQATLKTATTDQLEAIVAEVRGLNQDRRHRGGPVLTAT